MLSYKSGDVKVMKKYMKPIMESEAFVSNEYIGTCYMLKCTECSATEYSQSEYDMSNYEKVPQTDMYMYTKTINGEATCKTVGGVDITEKPDWIDRISSWDNSLNLLYWLEEAVYDWYKSKYGATSPVVNYHPAFTEETNSTNYPAHPNAS